VHPISETPAVRASREHRLGVHQVQDNAHVRRDAVTLRQDTPLLGTEAKQDRKQQVRRRKWRQQDAYSLQRSVLTIETANWHAAKLPLNKIQHSSTYVA
jgi:hypothetical protein